MSTTTENQAPPSMRESAYRRTVNYVFGRNALIGAAALMLLCISGYATWHGMSDFIQGVQAGGSAPVADGLRDIGGLSVSAEGLIITIVVALTFLMWLALRETFGARRRLGERLVTLPLYVFLALWSVGFGYGFWWSLISGAEATREGLRGQAEDVRDAVVGVAARLEAVKARLDSVVSLSERQMSREEASGGTCGVRSGAGRGPLYRAREGVRDSVDTLNQNIVENWLGQVDADLSQLNAQLSAASSALTGASVAERQAQFEASAAEIRGKARAIAARSDALGASYAAEMRQLGSELAIAPNEQGFSCHDPSLAALLRDAADEAERPAEVLLREAAFSEGAAGVANAVKNLWSNLGAYAGAFVGWVGSGFDSEGLALEEGAGGVTGRDLIALLAALGVDAGLFALTVLNPPGAPALSGDTASELRRALDVTKRRTGKNFEWLKKHLVAHGEDTFLVIPNLYQCLSHEIIDKATPEEVVHWAEPLLKASADDPAGVEQAREALKADTESEEALHAQSMNLLAGVLADLHLVKRLGWWKLRMARMEEARQSRSTIRGEDIRNHGLLSKARRALQFAGWSHRARTDVELFQLVDVEGLSPFLRAFNEADDAA